MRRSLVIATVALVATLLVAPVVAAAPDFGIIPPTTNPNTGLPVHEFYSVTDFRVDGDYGLTEIGAPIWQGITNALLLMNAVVVKLAVRSLEWAFNLSLLTTLLAPLDSALQKLAQAILQSSLIRVAITFAGLYCAWVGLVRRQTAQAIGIMVTLVTLIALSTWAFAGGLRWAVGFANDASSEISGAILTAGTGGRWDSSEAVVLAGENIYSIFVVQPWAITEFGSLEVAEKFQMGSVPGDEILKWSTEQREDWYKKLDKRRKALLTQWKADAAIPRLVLALLSFIIGLVFALMVMAMALGVLLCQAMALFVLFFAPIVFFLGLLLPHQGGFIVWKWASKLLGLIFTKVVLAALLAGVILMSSILYTVGQAHAWALGALLQLVLVVAVAVKWKDILNFVGDLPTRPEQALAQLSRWEGLRSLRGGARRTAAAAAATAGVLAAGGRKVKDFRDRRQAVATLNQQLGEDQLRAQKGGKPTLLMKRTDRRMQRGARTPWTRAEVDAEMRRNRALREIGADPLAVAAGGGTEGEYQSQVAAVRAQNADVRRRLSELRATYGPRVRGQAWQRSPVGRVLSFGRGPEPVGQADAPAVAPARAPQRPSRQAPRLSPAPASTPPKKFKAARRAQTADAADLTREETAVGDAPADAPAAASRRPRAARATRRVQAPSPGPAAHVDAPEKPDRPERETPRLGRGGDES